VGVPGVARIGSPGIAPFAFRGEPEPRAGATQPRSPDDAGTHDLPCVEIATRLPAAEARANKQQSPPAVSRKGNADDAERAGDP
jgi:hypothetical protein